jgi:K+-transporting ATPase A subunit
MKKNMGSKDKVIRISVAVLIALLYFGGIITGTLGMVLMVIATVFVLTSLVGFCPLYTLLEINSCPRQPSGK